MTEETAAMSQPAETVGADEVPAPKISLVVPVYNPGPNIRFLLDSLARQSMPAGEFEVVFVDDGSTDGTGESLRAECEKVAHFSYRRIENSGWPGRPRNVGTDLARGEYVFYADNDDVIPERGLELMHAYASTHRADVLVAREVGRGRVVSKEVFRSDVPDAELGRDPILGILTPTSSTGDSSCSTTGSGSARGVSGSRTTCSTSSPSSLPSASRSTRGSPATCGPSARTRTGGPTPPTTSGRPPTTT
ncbi:glycosyltransferase [Phycicoccus sp. HDW14]|uniref:glycosyltransferase family 2 protein n=1 Tax=Phycicoccus sp. HDW14 TaxID=2714941 RepID=UPI00140E4574|nr:glycosyltransferase [Phycicoccus sp. HDW14]QIM21470.1 glycosyltransferase [Phycicoccus sp. HDW14]